MPIIKVNDINMYFEVHGSGEPLVLIGGLGSDLTFFMSLVNKLSDSYKVIVFDNRGVGRTDMPDEPYTMDMMAKDTSLLLEALGIKKANILGVSMGGRIAQMLVINYPNQVINLVLVSTSARGTGSKRISWTFKLLGYFKWLPILKSKYPQPQYAFIRQRDAAVNFNCTNRLKEIKAPTLILHGNKDKTIPYWLAEEMSKGISNSKLVAFKGGHVFFFGRERQSFLANIIDFINSNNSVT